ncbi:MAG TPA: type III pantothenate kinase [Steroidobacteraceae bacterium]|jgi:type III pantothenate kinase
MSRLLLDIGNTRIKWALCSETGQRQRRFVRRGAIELAPLLCSAAAWSRLLHRIGQPGSVWVCNVGGAKVALQLRDALRRAGFARARFARTTAAAGGVRNAYPEPWRLGVDRWVALIGARHQFPGKDLCIVGLGTALTIDLLDARGHHRGGGLVPGPQLMIDALLQHTAGIRRRAGGRYILDAFEDAPGTPFARDTRTALIAGARHACAALIERGVQQGRRMLGRSPRLILTGGAARAIIPLLRSDYRREDDLVLRGLAVLADGAERPIRIKSRRA